MTPPSRREKLETMLADEPGDTFLRYSLALEFQKEDNHQRSLDLLDALTKDDPPYVPAFLMAAQQLAQLERIEEARTVLRDGVEQARAQGNDHAAGEMAELLASLGAEGH